MSENTSRIPLTILTGFLGSGKTTLLNRILAEHHGQRIAIIENEFGEIGIDSGLILSSEEEIHEMNNGCICCTVRGDLIRILGRLLQRRDKFDRIIIETTGLADPAPVVQTFLADDEMKATYQVDGVVTVVDSRHLSLHIEDSDECQEQIAFADLILLNKVDLVAESDLPALEGRIRAINGAARILRTTQCNIPIQNVIDVGGFDLQRALRTRPAFLDPEYPFEWSGSYALPAGVHALRLEEGPDPALSIAILAQTELTNSEVLKLRERAMILFSDEPIAMAPGSTLIPSPCHFSLELSKNGPKEFLLEIPADGRYTLFLQHHPSEFQMQLHTSSGTTLEPEDSHEFNPGHEHDSTVSSVGIAVSGIVSRPIFNFWISNLVRSRGADLFRMKGVLNVEPTEGGSSSKVVFHGVHMIVESLPEVDWLDHEERTNQLVFIGRNLDRAELNEGFRACLTSA